MAIARAMAISAGKGEAICLAIAHERKFYVACDERGRFLRTVRETIGEDCVVNTPGIILMAIRQGLITVEEADELKNELEARSFKMKFNSFAEIAGREAK